MADMLLTDDPVIAADLSYLLQHDPVFSVYFPNGYAMERQRSLPDMAGLARVIIGQQVSTAAARSLWTKFTDKFDPYDTALILKASDDDLRGCGLSRQKIGYLRGLAQAIQDGSLQPATWADKDDETVTAEITALKGFGLWSAQMVLMFHLARPDIWPYGDLGIQVGLQTYLNLPERPDHKTTQAAYKHFKGRATSAALLLWSIKDGGI